jgi:hypothetical protein
MVDEENLRAMGQLSRLSGAESRAQEPLKRFDIRAVVSASGELDGRA